MNRQDFDRLGALYDASLSVIAVGNDTRRRRGNASVFGKSHCYGNEIAALRSQ